MIRRGLALGGGLIVVILIVLGVKGCLDARANRALTDYARNVTQIVQESERTSKSFFGKLEDPGALSVTDFENVVNAEASAVTNQASRVDGLSAPGDMGSAQDGLELVYQLRASAMSEIAQKMGTALGEAGSAKATAGIANQMRKLLASDVLYETVVRREIDNVLADNGIEGSDVPESEFLPGTEWLEESTVSAALGAVSGSSGAATPGIHGLGLVGASVNGTELIEGGAAAAAGEETAEVEVQVQNQGESTENGVTVSVSVDGGNTLQQNISTIAAGEISSVRIPLTPTPSGQVTLDVEVETVPGEQVSTNNKASYTVEFE
jgi:CARDB protein